MSKIVWVSNINEYMCTSLEYIRTMDKTRDYSGLMARVEDIQLHANRMEEALWSKKGVLDNVHTVLEDKEKTDKEKLKAIKKALKG